MMLMDARQIEQRRLEVLSRLDREANPLAIFYNLSVLDTAAFKLGDRAYQSIRKGLSDRRRRNNESAGLATVKVAAMTPDKTKTVYEMTSFVFESVGTKDSVMTIERELLGAGEIECHTHIFHTPDYLGYTDVGDLIAAIEGPAWVHPLTKMMQPAIRIFGILSIFPDRAAQFDFYQHDLREPLIAKNNYGLKRLGLILPVGRAY